MTLTQEQDAAAMSVMRGQFTLNDVRTALIRAGVPLEDAQEAAELELQTALEAGFARPFANRPDKYQGTR